MKRNAIQWVCGLLVGVLWFVVISRYLSNYDFNALLHAMVLNCAAFLLGYASIKPLKTLSVWKFLLLIAVLTLMNWLIFIMWRNQSILLRFGEFIWFSRAVLPFIVSILLNIGFLKYVCKIDTRNAIMVGALIGMVHAQSLIVGLPISSGQ